MIASLNRESFSGGEVSSKAGMFPVAIVRVGAMSDLIDPTLCIFPTLEVLAMAMVRELTNTIQIPEEYILSTEGDD